MLRAFLIALTTLAIAGLVTTFVLFQQFESYRDSDVLLSTEPTLFDVQRGSSWRAIANGLKASGLVDDADRLYWYGRFADDTSGLKAGQYELPAEATPSELIDIFSSGKVVQFQVTLVEGWTVKQVLNRLKSNEDLVKVIQSTTAEELAKELELDVDHSEGMFLAETFLFENGTSDKDILLRAHADLKRVLDEAWENRGEDLPLETPYQALTLASIVEKETALAEERPQVAGVFTLRLKKGMLLQTDPTVIYGMGDAYKGNIRKRDLERDTPYNTYTRPGLTPTPIAIVGKSAIEAAVQPNETGHLYFVANGEGGHTFSKTYQQHQRAVRKYIQWQRNQ